MSERPSRWVPEQWAEEGKKAILDLLADRVVAPWAEVEARIAAGWKDFRQVQPLQLGGARRELVASEQICEERTKHDPPVTTVRLPDQDRNKRAVARLRGEKRKLYRSYLKWTGDPAACGHHAEGVVLNSMKAAAGQGGLAIPRQRKGHVPEVRGVTVEPGPLDALAFLADFPAAMTNTPMVIEVKNVHEWIYPPDRRLWELLVKAAGLVAHGVEVLPVIVCVRSAWQTGQMARDIGFLTCDMRVQVFTPDEERIDPLLFATVQDEFGLPIVQTDDALPTIVDFMSRIPRREEPDPDEGRRVEWYVLQTKRFATLAPAVLDFAVLSGDLPTESRAKTLIAFEKRVAAEATWHLVGGWAGAH